MYRTFAFFILVEDWLILARKGTKKSLMGLISNSIKEFYLPKTKLKTEYTKVLSIN
jgi:hypothetical protein